MCVLSHGNKIFFLLFISSMRGVGYCIVRELLFFLRILIHILGFSTVFLLLVLVTIVFFPSFAGEYANYLALISGFSVNKVIIKGNKHVSEIDVLGALKLDEKISIISFDAEKARQAITAFPWVAAATVQKLYPNRLEIFVTERIPFALWQKNGSVNVIDEQGYSITSYNSFFSHSLPLFIGSGAELHAAKFLKQVQNFPDIYTRALAYIRVADRRWDILLENGVRIQLPEKNAFECLSVALNLEGKNVLLSYHNVERIDLRIKDRIIVALSKNSTMFSNQKQKRVSNDVWSNLQKARGT